jgi:hypothetical protein
METNPVKQRLFKLTEQWRTQVLTNPDVRVFSFIGASSVDYNMIYAFTLFHMSDESNIDDLFFCLRRPFETKNVNIYGRNIINELGECVKAWNSDEDLTKKTGSINWQPLPDNQKLKDEEYFVNNLNNLAEKLISKDEQFMVVSMLPLMVQNYKAYRDWVANVIDFNVSAKIRLIIYDTYDLKAFDNLSKQFNSKFKQIHLDLDMVGAMNQILEETKNSKTKKSDRDGVTLQQLILKLTEAIGKNDKAKIDIFQKQSLDLARQNNWPHMEALIYYFIHSYFATNNNESKAHEVIDEAILKGDEAVNKKILDTSEIKYYYRIAKGNLYFMNKRFAEAAKTYKACLDIDRSGTDKHMLLGIYQMLAVSLKHNGQKRNALNYFFEGWDLVKNEPEEFIKNSTLLKYYAKEMISVDYQDEALIDYYSKFNHYWGKDWNRNIQVDTLGL